MIIMRRLVAPLAIACLIAQPAAAFQDTHGVYVPPVAVVDPASNSGALFSNSNPGHVSGSISLSGFTPSAAGARMTPLAVATSDSSASLPTGAVVVVSNVGLTNPMYCNVNGVAATTSDQLIGANSWFAFTAPNGVTTLHCIATGSATTANAVGGAGLPTGAGGGGGGGSSSNASVGLTGAAVPGSGTYGAMNVGGNLTGLTGTANGLKVDSSAVTQPVSAASLPLPTGAALDASLTTLHNDLTTLNTTASSSIPAGSATIGALVANQSVNVAQVNGSTTPVGAGAASTAGVQRVAAAQDTTTIAGSAPGTAGLASANVMTVQGIASGTNLNTAIASCSTCNGNGQATMANSTPVVLASNQSAVSVQAAQSGNWTDRIVGNAGGTLDTAAGTAASTGLGVQGLDTAGTPLAISPPQLTTGHLVSGVTAAPMSGTTSTQVVALVSAKRLYITHVSCVNTHATVDTLVNIQDGSGGSTLWTLAAGHAYAGEVDSGGGMPMFWTTAGNGLYAADATTGASVTCKASGFSG